MKEKKVTETANEIFAKWINSIPVGDYPSIRAEIIDECKITSQVFRHWKNGNSNIPPLAQEKIEEIAKRNQLNKVFTN